MDRHPAKVCFKKVQSNSTFEYHECMCNFDYSFSKGRIKGLKIKHCTAVSEMYKMGGFFYLFMIAGIIFGLLLLCVIICSCKWYFKTKKNPCKCLSFLCCCNPRRRTKEHVIDSPLGFYDPNGSGHMWSPVNLPPFREEELSHSQNNEAGGRDGSCMSFCTSDPVQDCCEFFDCDIMWSKKSVYNIPIFGKKKTNLQRRPTRPAPAPPPPPKAVVLPHLKDIDDISDDFECEPVPEAPPSPEPIRHMPAKALYVDPLSFLQRPFLKMTTNDKSEDDGDKQEALYVKFKNLVMSKVKKSSSTASINKLGVSCNPDGDSESGFGMGKKNKTASLASLHNLDDTNLDRSYGSKRSLSMASLHNIQQECPIAGTGNVMNDPRSRVSVISSATIDDVPPSARIDEYIDLEEMSKRMEAKMKANQAYAAAQLSNQSSPTKSCATNSSYTPDFMPASAFSTPPQVIFNPVQPQVASSFNPVQPQVASSFNHVQPPVAPSFNPLQPQVVPSYNSLQPQLVSSFNPLQPQVFENTYRRPAAIDPTEEIILQPGQYYPAIPASQGRPAVPARTLTTPVYSMSPTGTPNKQKPMVPPRPPNIEGGQFSRNSTLTRSPRPIKPTGPPPPPPGNRPPIESSI